MKDFSPFREKIIGIHQTYPFPYGERAILYADWTASGRLYRPIETFISEMVGPYVANPHTDATVTSALITSLYRQAKAVYKKHVHADEDDVILFAGFGMTSVVNKLQRLLGLRIPERLNWQSRGPEKDKALVVLTHMEHHSNHITWNECRCQVEIIRPVSGGLPDLNHLEEILKKNSRRKLKIGSFTACSNVTGIQPPIHEMAEIMHRYGGFCFADYASAAPYTEIHMHTEKAEQKLDAIFFSPHKFLGGPGSPGVMIMDHSLYSSEVPDQPGGGTFLWTNPWGEQRYYKDIELREDGGTPGFLQAIKGALALLVKEDMGVEAIQEKDELLKEVLMEKLAAIPEVMILEPHVKKRLAIVSFYVKGCHHNLIVQLLNDRFGIQTRGGCSCAGPYGHFLLQIDRPHSKRITDKIDRGDLSEKPGWVRISLHPTMTLEEVDCIADSVRQVLVRYRDWGQDYLFDPCTAEFRHKEFALKPFDIIREFRRNEE